MLSQLNEVRTRRLILPMKRVFKIYYTIVYFSKRQRSERLSLFKFIYMQEGDKTIAQII